jgi:hypothetical protein
VLVHFPLTGGVSEVSDRGLFTTPYQAEATVRLKKQQALQEDGSSWEQELERDPGKT